jgi:uncharacterized membrane protein YbhN (UPF0104 family)
MAPISKHPGAEVAPKLPVSPRPNRVKRRTLATWLIRLAKAAVSFALLYLLLKTMQKDALGNALARANGTLILLAVLLVPINLALQGIRWWILVRSEMPSVRFGKTFASFLGGLSLGLITPGRVGEIGRVFLLEAPSRLRLAGLHVLDKMYFAGGVALLGPFLLFWMPGFNAALPAGIRTEVGVIVSLLPFVYLIFALTPMPLKSLLLAIQLAIGAKGRTLELLRAYDGIQPIHCIRLTLATALQFIIILTQFWLISLAFQPVAWWVAAHTYAAALFVKTALPISLGNLGVGEWAAVSFYERYSIANTTGFSASLFLFGMNVLIPGILGLWVLFRMRPQALLRRLGLSREETP